MGCRPSRALPFRAGETAAVASVACIWGSTYVAADNGGRHFWLMTGLALGAASLSVAAWTATVPARTRGYLVTAILTGFGAASLHQFQRERLEYRPAFKAGVLVLTAVVVLLSLAAARTFTETQRPPAPFRRPRATAATNQRVLLICCALASSVANLVLLIAVN